MEQKESSSKERDLLPSSAEHELHKTIAENTLSHRHTLTRTVSSIRFGVHSIQNQRPEMEDAHRAVLGRTGTDCSLPEVDANMIEMLLGSFSFFAVFDGHGGACAAEFCCERVYALLAAERSALSADPKEALRLALIKTEEEWLIHARKNELMDGTTLAVALVDQSRCCCIVGNVGDTEVLLGTQDFSGHTFFRILTEVHHLKRNEKETARVAEVGGRMWKGRLGHPKFIPQVVSLAISRSVGDLFFKDEQYTGEQQSGLTAEPFMNSVDICTDDVAVQFLLLGCDGFWDVIAYNDALDSVFKHLAEGTDPQTISEILVGLARDAGSSDNITVMVCMLRET